MTFPGEDSVARNLRVRDRLLDELKLAPGEERTVEWNVRQAIAHLMTPKSTGKVPGILAQSTPRETRYPAHIRVRFPASASGNGLERDQRLICAGNGVK